MQYQTIPGTIRLDSMAQHIECHEKRARSPEECGIDALSSGTGLGFGLPVLAAVGPLQLRKRKGRVVAVAVIAPRAFLDQDLQWGHGTEDRT